MIATLTTADFLNNLRSSDFQSFLIVCKAYRENTDIFIDEIGFNQNSGYVYFALENGIQIASCFGNNAEFLFTDFETGEEFFYDTYEQAIEKLNTY